MSPPLLKRYFSFPKLKLQTCLDQVLKYKFYHVIRQTWIDKGTSKSVLLAFHNVLKFPEHWESVDTPLCRPQRRVPLHLVDCSDIGQKKMLTWPNQDQSLCTYGKLCRRGNGLCGTWLVFIISEIRSCFF